MKDENLNEIIFNGQFSGKLGKNDADRAIDKILSNKRRSRQSTPPDWNNKYRVREHSKQLYLDQLQKIKQNILNSNLKKY